MYEETEEDIFVFLDLEDIEIDRELVPHIAFSEYQLNVLKERQKQLNYQYDNRLIRKED